MVALSQSAEPGENNDDWNQVKQHGWEGEYLHFMKPKEQLEANNV